MESENDVHRTRSLDPQAIILWRIQGLLRTILFWIPVTGIGAAMGLSFLGPLLISLLAGSWILACTCVALLWPKLEFDAFRYSIRQHDLLVQSGVLFRRWSSIPFDRIQHVDTRQGPLERSLGLSRLLIYTAAGMSADGSIAGLASADAEQLRDALSRRGGDDGV